MWKSLVFGQPDHRLSEKGKNRWNFNSFSDFFIAVLYFSQNEYKSDKCRFIEICGIISMAEGIIIKNEYSYFAEDQNQIKLGCFAYETCYTDNHRMSSL